MNNIFKWLMVLITFPLLSLLFGCNSEDAFSDSKVRLVRIDIVTKETTASGASKMSLPTESKQAFEATGFYSDGSAKKLSNLKVENWNSDDESVGYFIEPGRLKTRNNVGTTNIHVEKDGVVSNIISLEVFQGQITDIIVTPPLVNIAKGQTEQLIATALYDNGMSFDVTNSVIWKAFETNTASVSSGGLLLGVDAGTTTVTATKDGIVSNVVDVNVTMAVITSITVTPSPVNLAEGQTQQLTATAIYSDSTSSDVTNSATWIPVDTATATVTPSGLLSGVDVGMTTLTAEKDGVTSNTVS
ncbi:Ig-like domain-containing protein, partial [Vibrio chagasii]|uniref:Ig-like domain-containing protein n=1 Tax=Vibrio chagasii TaxID=170679 RepID=UPI00373701B5